MQRTDIVIVGAGQAGLAMSRCLAGSGIDHVLLERGRIGERWRSARWDSLRLLTPNWMTRLPGHAYAGPEPDGFMARDQVTALLDRYARGFAAPVVTGAAVRLLAAAPGGYRLATDRGDWLARSVVIATGACEVPQLPGFASALPASIAQLAAAGYRRPAQLPPGGVLVVGGSSTGLQLAREIRRSGRPVTLAVGRHTRMVRSYRGRDIFAWLAATGIADARWNRVPDLAAARRQPSMQLSGAGPIDLARLAAEGVRVVGRVLGVEGGRVMLGDDLAADCAASDARLRRVLGHIDGWIAASGVDAPPDPAAWRAPAHPVSDRRRLDLAAEGISSVVWATGYARDYRWLRLPVLDRAGDIVQRGGVTAAPGVYTLGLRFQCHRNSNLIDGVGRDAEALAAAIARRFRAPLAA